MSDEARMNGDEPEQDADAGQSQQQADAGPSSAPQPERRDSDKRLVIVGSHLLVAMLVLSMWAAADTWQAVTGFAMPVFPKRRFQHGALPVASLRQRLPGQEAEYRRQFLGLYN